MEIVKLRFEEQLFNVLISEHHFEKNQCNYFNPILD